MISRTVTLPAGRAVLTGDLTVPPDARAVVLFAHGSGSSRHSPRNREVAAGLRTAGLGTLLIDLLTEDEERLDARTAELRFDIPLLGHRLVAALDWLAREPGTSGLPVVLFGASTGAGAALVAAARRPDRVRAVVSRGGRPDLAGDALNAVRAPVLLIVGGRDTHVLRLNEEAARRLPTPPTLHVVPGATHLFEEPGALDEVTEAARQWCDQQVQITEGR
ncbi:dienelactone hydrolase family protein [Streptomyces collinus]|uniref:Dienelactone hydrolase n=2 Tax=Streptomyces TaxID=1883 RepID=A0AA89QH77_STRCU|nr:MULTISPECIES: alpha/beta family hydrolase [Streptomyces]MBB5815555.1 dienelactone hydrolase [Streptomyces collinus]MEC7058401.1 alpha/beta family hydrolase [Streptomyces violaceochromogenes]WMX68468.1 dienelactone hydrolase family protein [Streptomyces collinus]GHC47853.1 hydrolase [Streptomyces violaceochromogenes]